MLAKRAGMTRQRHPALTTTKGDFAMADRADITPELCRQLLRYEPDTGKLFWLPRPRSMSKNDRAHSVWNARFAGKEALTANDGRGYRLGMVSNRMMKAHRVAWAIYHGQWPDVIDHINGDPSDNRIVNLRSVPFDENMRNQRRRSDNASGRTGVYWDKGAWVAEIKRGPHKRCLGRFSTVEAASRARDQAEDQMGFHDNHGRG